MTLVTLSQLRPKIRTSTMDHEAPTVTATESSSMTSSETPIEPAKDRNGISTMNLALIMGGVTIGIAAAIVGSAVFLRRSLRESVVDLPLQFQKVLPHTLLRTVVEYPSFIRVKNVPPSYNPN